MDNQKTIIVLLCIIIAILVVGVVVFSPLMAKEDSALTINDKKITVGDSLAVKLTDKNGNPIANQTVNIKLTDKEGITIDEDVVTNSKGNAKFKMDEKGKYSVECSFKGSDKYSASDLNDNISVKKVKTNVITQEKTTSKSMYDSNGFMYPEYGPDYDSIGTSREEAMAGDYRYLEDEIDGKIVGVYAPYDPNAGTYHW